MMNMKKFFAAIGLVFLLQNAWAIDLHSAKAQGLVGEANSGYLDAVKKPVSDEVKALIADVNAKRRTKFKNAANNTGTTLAQVSNRFYELAVQKTARGNYYQDKNGSWRQK